ncbi:DegQ family serine endoprotease [Fulvimarina manganoxydans]|uniref:DegQ family serine endoprotease n=1 Tax=Fulvimarina manganoxydans TaxID=937218 RepID=UPI003B5CDCC0
MSAAVAAILLCTLTVPMQDARAWSLGDLFGGQSQSDETSPAEPRPAPAAPLPSVPPSQSQAEELAPRLGSGLGEGERVPESRGEISLTFAPLIRRSAPSVVNVYAARAVPQSRSPFAGDPFFGQFFGGPREREPRMESSLGSGVIVDPSGLVVTNNHVVADADEVKIAFADGREFETSVLLKDENVDLAVLKIDGADTTFPALPIADSDGLEIGDLVLAIGNPFGIGQTVTNGIISALARTHVSRGDFGFFIQTDAAINPGNSGGALIDMKGSLVGVNTAIFSRSGGSNGIGFAIPSNMVSSFVRAAKAGGRFERPYVGASFSPVTPDIAEALGLGRPAGALVHAVAEGSPAAEAGLEVGDVVLKVGSFTVNDPDGLGYRLATTGIGHTVDLTVLRNESQTTLSLPLMAAPEEPTRDEERVEGRNPFSGATVWNLSPRVAEDLGMPLEKRGVVVADVEPRSLAARFGLRPRDVITEVNGNAVEDVARLKDILSERWDGWDFEIDRGGRRLVQRVR